MVSWFALNWVNDYGICVSFGKIGMMDKTFELIAYVFVSVLQAHHLVDELLKSGTN